MKILGCNLKKPLPGQYHVFVFKISLKKQESPNGLFDKTNFPFMTPFITPYNQH